MTYTISNSIPPRTDLIFQKIPIGVVLRQRDIIRSRPNRSTVGEFISSITSAGLSELGNNSKQYEVEQVLNFEVIKPPQFAPITVSRVTELNYNNNIFNIESLNLTGEDVKLISTISNDVQIILTNKLNDLKLRRNNLEQLIGIEQKKINEFNATISALKILVSQVANDEISKLILKLETDVESSATNMAGYVTDIDKTSTDISLTVDQLRSIISVVR